MSGARSHTRKYQNYKRKRAKRRRNSGEKWKPLPSWEMEYEENQGWNHQLGKRPKAGKGAVQEGRIKR